MAFNTNNRYVIMFTAPVTLVEVGLEVKFTSRVDIELYGSSGSILTDSVC